MIKDHVLKAADKIPKPKVFIFIFSSYGSSFKFQVTYSNVPSPLYLFSKVLPLVYMSLYADDAVIYCSHPNHDRLKTILEDSLSRMYDWCKSNYIKINVQKN